jgi:hypothetical protein
MMIRERPGLSRPLLLRPFSWGETSETSKVMHRLTFRQGEKRALFHTAERATFAVKSVLF